MDEVGKKEPIKSPKDKATENGEAPDPRDLLAIQLQCMEDTKNWFPDIHQDLGHQVIGMVGELGEFAEIVKKIDRGSLELNDDVYAKMCLELADILIYLCCAGTILNVDLAMLYHQKREINVQRFGTNTST